MATNFNYDCLAQCFLDDLGAKKNGYRPSLPYGYKGSWQFTLLDADVSKVAGYRAAVDTDFSSATAPMCRTASGIEFSTDTDGNTVLNVPIDAKTARFQDVCDGRQSVTAYMEIAGLDADGNQCFYICFPINATYVIDPEGAGEVEPVAVTNLTESQVAAIAYANSPTITVEQTDTGATVTATDKNGTTTATWIGAKGEKGDTGAQGEKGERGEKGDTGAPNTLTIGTVTAGTEPIATITGDAPNQVLNLTLVKGDTGEAGTENVTHTRNVLTIPSDNKIHLTPSLDTSVISFNKQITLVNDYTDYDTVGYCELVLDATGTSAVIAAGDGVYIEGSLATTRRNIAVVRFENDQARLYIVADYDLPSA